MEFCHGLRIVHRINLGFPSSDFAYVSLILLEHKIFPNFNCSIFKSIFSKLFLFRTPK